MLRVTKLLGFAVLLLGVALVASLPAAAAPPAPQYGGQHGGYPKHRPDPWRDPPPVTIGIDPAWYVYYPAGLKPAADALGISPDELSDYLWAGGSLADLAERYGVELRFLRNAVDGAVFRLRAGYVSDSPWQADGMAYPVPTRQRWPRR